MMLFLSLVLTLQQVGTLDEELKTFRVWSSAGLTDTGAVNQRSAVEWALTIYNRLDFPEDKKTKRIDNYFRPSRDSIFLAYRSRVYGSFTSSNGRLFAWSIEPPETKAKNVSLEDCVAKAREWYEAAGGKEELALRSEHGAYLQVNRNEQEVHVVFQFLAPGTSYRFGMGVEAIMDRTYGTPNYMYIAKRPDFESPRRVVPVDIAAANAAAAAFEFVKWEVLEAASQPAAYVIPNYRGLPNRMNETHQRRARDKKACLMYEVTVHDASAEPDREKGRPFVQVYVDAESGEPVALYPAFRMMGGGSVSRKPLDWGAGPWQVGKTMGKVSPAGGAPPKAGRRVALANGRTVVFAQFDQRTGLVWVVQDGKTKIGRPERTLLKALASAQNPKAFKMLDIGAK